MLRFEVGALDELLKSPFYALWSVHRLAAV